MSDPNFASPTFVHRITRRAFFHDYTRKGRYMITMTAERGRPSLSVLDKGAPSVVLTPLGEAVREELYLIGNLDRPLHVEASVIMPDHIHFIIFVSGALPKPLGSYIGAFKGACSRRWAAMTGAVEVSPLFVKGFHDRIIWDDGHRVVASGYIADNPLRAAIRRSRPDLFRRYNRAQIGDREYAAYGNIFLLKDFDKRPVIIHRGDSVEARRNNENAWLSCAANGGVLVSPFISPDEKVIRDKALALGGRLIVIRNDGFEERFKPVGRDFDLCAAGRVLLVAPWPEALARSVVSRVEALSMNAGAVRLSSYTGAVILR